METLAQDAAVLHGGRKMPDGRGDGQAPSPGDPAEAVSLDFLIAMLAAVARMAMRSTRRQADLQTALRGQRLIASPARIVACARHLEQMGYVRGLLKLADGGILLTVTPEGFDRLRLTSYRDIVEPGRT